MPFPSFIRRIPLNKYLPSLNRYPPGIVEQPEAFDKDTSIHHQNHAKLDDIRHELHQQNEEFSQARYPIDLPLLPVLTNSSSQALSQPWHVDYRGRKHLFAFVSGTTPVVFVSDDGFSLSITNTWTNVGFPEGTIFMPTTASVNTMLRLRATDEVIP